MKNFTKAHLALLGTNIFFAINYTVVKYLINGQFVKPFGLNLIRVGVSALLLWILFFLKPVKSVIHKKDYGRFFLCALTGIAINQLLFLKGLSLTYSIHASLLMLTTPILITVFAVLILHENLNVYKIFGLILGVSGAIVLLTARERTGNASDVLWGDVLIILNAISYTFYFILVKPLMKIYNPVVVIRMVFTIGFFLIIPFCWSEFNEIVWQNFDALAFFNLTILVIGGTFLAYLFNVYGIKILGATMAGTYMYSQPFFAAAIAFIFLGEPLSFYKIIAAVLIFSGVFLANKSKKSNEN
ncbi:MAG: DMT family transporter [Ferruginibacter sp.]